MMLIVSLNSALTIKLVNNLIFHQEHVSSISVKLVYIMT
jgi:hypothetical protein